MRCANCEKAEARIKELEAELIERDARDERNWERIKKAEDELAKARAEAFEEVRYFLRGVGTPDDHIAGTIDEFCTRKIVTLGGTFDDDRKFAGIKAAEAGQNLGRDRE